MVSLLGCLLLSIMPTQGLSMTETETEAKPKSSVPVLAFHATWCKPCKKMENEWKKIEKAGYKVRYVDIDKEPEYARKWGVTSVPTTIAARKRFVGFTTASTILKALRTQRPLPRGINLGPMP